MSSVGPRKVKLSLAAKRAITENNAIDADDLIQTIETYVLETDTAIKIEPQQIVIPAGSVTDLFSFEYSLKKVSQVAKSYSIIIKDDCIIIDTYSFDFSRFAEPPKPKKGKRKDQPEVSRDEVLDLIAKTVDYSAKRGNHSCAHELMEHFSDLIADDLDTLNINSKLAVYK